MDVALVATGEVEAAVALISAVVQDLMLLAIDHDPVTAAEQAPHLRQPYLHAVHITVEAHQREIVLDLEQHSQSAVPELDTVVVLERHAGGATHGNEALL